MTSNENRNTATIKARELGAEIVDPRPYATGSIREVYRLYPHLEKVLPAVLSIDEAYNGGRRVGP